MKIPKKFYQLSKSDQVDYAVQQMQIAQQEADIWRKLAIKARGKHIPEPTIERPDEQLLKDGI
jgi:hypothetical protein